jgi:hypothetical protein
MIRIYVCVSVRYVNGILRRNVYGERVLIRPGERQIIVMEDAAYALLCKQHIIFPAEY